MNNLHKVLVFEVEGLPIGKSSPKVRRGGWTYYPKTTVDYMKAVKSAAEKAGAVPWDMPCSMMIMAHFPIPESYREKQKSDIRAGKVFYTKKPDTDNLSKIKDALNGVAFRDDSLVYHEQIYKFWSDRPRLEVVISYQEVPDDSMLGFRS